MQSCTPYGFFASTLGNRCVGEWWCCTASCQYNTPVSARFGNTFPPTLVRAGVGGGRFRMSCAGARRPTFATASYNRPLPTPSLSCPAWCLSRFQSPCSVSSCARAPVLNRFLIAPPPFLSFHLTIADSGPPFPDHFCNSRFRRRMFCPLPIR